jgi:hypothetical protein
MLVADLDLDALAAAVGRPDPMLINVFVERRLRRAAAVEEILAEILLFRVTGDSEAGFAARRIVTLVECVVGRKNALIYWIEALPERQNGLRNQNQ